MADQQDGEGGREGGGRSVRLVSWEGVGGGGGQVSAGKGGTGERKKYLTKGNGKRNENITE